ncbi:extracellular solute-binding protein [Paenibacillus antri]|uniref:Extracellular solute-binding protein n=1 Tax=Paenibacillus antri TaxID=2582848 RepID=A0A5R9G9X8_9BACL|nr:extracellular solute-binding protein [Paenibacillus antri]TLS53247.1 extracellular solute-binding protein [Paenibacillus antri]
MKRTLRSGMAIMLASLIAVLSACTERAATDEPPGNDVPSNGEAAQPEGGASAEPAKEPEPIGEFPDAFPIPKAVDPSSYAYDDLSEKYEIEIMLPGAFNQPIPDDPIKKYLDEKYNVDLTLTNLTAADLRNNVAVRFASGDAPDVVVMPFKDVAISLYKQGQLAEASDILPYMPQAAQYVTKTFANWATVDGEMIGIPRYSTFQDNWGFFIREDWLKTLGLSMPKTVDDLYAYAEAVTKNDPDGDGKADTWFMGGAGGGNGFGMLDSLRSAFGHPSWNVVDGKINHPMLDGTTRGYLEFLKKLNDEQLLSPDWYTISWEPFKTYTFNDQVGMVHYPGANLIDETYHAKNRDMSVLNVWKPIAPPSADAGEEGKYAPGGAPGGMFVFSKKAVEDPGKMKRIAHIIDTMIYPNENYWTVSQGGGPEIYPDGSRVVFNETDGTNVFFIDKEKHPAAIKPELNSLPDWQFVGYTLLWQIYDDEVGKIGGEHNIYVNNLPRHENFGIFITLDGPTESKINDFQLKNEIAFVLGNRSFDDWDAYVGEWKASGGQKLMEQAAEQLDASMP